MFSGKKEASKFPSGGNHQRESFRESVSKTSKPEAGGHQASPTKGGGGKTEITHNPDGSHTVKHHDGETSEHPNAGHMAAHLHSKHMGGEVANIHSGPEGSATTHRIGMDGMMEGPMDHGSAGEAAAHLGKMMGSGEMEGNEAQAGLGSGDMDGIY